MTPRWIARMASCALAALVGAGAGAAEPAGEAPPRLWKARSDDGTTFYVLGATHLGLPSEYGRYFDGVVLPAFDRADELRFEGVGNGRPEPRPACDDAPLDAAGRATIARLRDEVARRRIEAWDVRRAQMARSGHPDLETKAERDEESRALARDGDVYALLLEYRMDSLVVARAAAASAPAASGGPRLRDEVARTLRARRPALPVRDLDSAFGVARAYCRAGRQRALFVEASLAASWSEAPEFVARIPAAEAAFAQVLREERPAQGELALPAALDGPMVCDRTREWLQELRTLHDGRTRFLVVGANHLFDLHRGGVDCPGLLAGLAQAGWAVELLR